MVTISMVPPTKNENKKIELYIPNLLDSFFFYVLITYLNYCSRPSSFAKSLDFSDSKLCDELKDWFIIGDEYMWICLNVDLRKVYMIDLIIIILIMFVVLID
jgi:hypothetical protein